MKKIIFVVAAVSLIFGLAACVSVDKSSKEEFQKATGTPKNSVVFYGFLSCNSQQSFAQMDPNFAPDNQKMKNSIFISKPVAPGSTYALEYIQGAYRSGNVIWNWDQYLPLQTAGNPLIVHVSKKPGLQFIGFIDSYEMLRGRTARIEKYDEAGERTCLEGALELYEGTEWESVIRERLDELNGKK